MIGNTVHFMFRTLARCVVFEFANVNLEFCQSFARPRSFEVLKHGVCIFTSRDMFAKVLWKFCSGAGKSETAFWRVGGWESLTHIIKYVYIYISNNQPLAMKGLCDASCIFTRPLVSWSSHEPMIVWQVLVRTQSLYEALLPTKVKHGFCENFAEVKKYFQKNERFFMKEFRSTSVKKLVCFKFAAQCAKCAIVQPLGKSDVHLFYEQQSTEVKNHPLKDPRNQNQATYWIQRLFRCHSTSLHGSFLFGF